MREVIFRVLFIIAVYPELSSDNSVLALFFMRNADLMSRTKFVLSTVDLFSDKKPSLSPPSLYIFSISGKFLLRQSMFFFASII